jgi:hypothetical protein
VFEHVVALEAKGFREIDEHECQSSAGTSAATQCFMALRNKSAETFTVVTDDGPIAMFGQCPIVETGVEPGWCVLWFLATPDLFEVKKDFMLQISGWLDWLQRYSPYGINYVSVDNDIALKWCKAVGFDIQTTTPYGLHGEPFRAVLRILKK